MKIAVVTGASGGIGIAVTKQFVENGYYVIAHYNKNKKPLDDLICQLSDGDLSDYIFPLEADFSKLNEVEDFASVIFKNFKHVDALINVAGIDLYKMLQDTSCEELTNVMNINLNSAYVLTQKIIGCMCQRRYGKIIYVSSVWGSVGGSLETAYSASKAGLIGLTKALAKEVASSGVNVNCVCPGAIDTKMNAGYTEEERQGIINDIPMGRFGLPSEIAKLIWFLCSEDAKYITGQIITSDGGFTL